METVGIAVSFGKEKIELHQELINSVEESKLRQRLIALKGKENKAYETHIAILADYAAGMPERVEFIDGEEVKTPLSEKGTPAEAIRSYFAEQTRSKERMADSALRGYLIALQPDISFL